MRPTDVQCINLKWSRYMQWGRRKNGCRRGWRDLDNLLYYGSWLFSPIGDHQHSLLEGGTFSRTRCMCHCHGRAIATYNYCNCRSRGQCPGCRWHGGRIGRRRHEKRRSMWSHIYRQPHKTNSKVARRCGAARRTSCDHTKPDQAKATTPMHTQQTITQNQIGQRRRCQCTHNMRSHKTRLGKGDDANAHTTDNHTKPDRAKATTPMHTQQTITQNQIGQRRRCQCTHNMQSHKTRSSEGDDTNAHITCDYTKPDRAKTSSMHIQCTNANTMHQCKHNAHT
jgi:hypothetical protein